MGRPVDHVQNCPTVWIAYSFGPQTWAQRSSFQASRPFSPYYRARESKLDGVKYGPGSIIQGIDTIASKNVSNKCSPRNRDIFWWIQPRLWAKFGRAWGYFTLILHDKKPVDFMMTMILVPVMLKFVRSLGRQQSLNIGQPIIVCRRFCLIDCGDPN